jgi:hypothetical protein
MIIIDRFEGSIAICEIDGAMVDIPLSRILGNAKEGDVLLVGEGDSFRVDSVKTESRKTAITERFKRLKTKNKKK